MYLVPVVQEAQGISEKNSKKQGAKTRPNTELQLGSAYCLLLAWLSLQP
jgi:hypothetical protein